MIKNSHTIILPYKTHWIEDYKSEKEKLLSLFGGKILNIEHIGSTSVEGLESKPIVDIVIVVEDFEPAEKFNNKLKSLGYTLYSSSTERHFYTKGDPVKYHLSIAFANRGGFWVRQILFRDYLRSHDDSKKEYGELKKFLLKNDPTGVNSYFSGKDNFVNEILKLANWKNNQLYSEYISKKLKIHPYYQKFPKIFEKEKNRISKLLKDVEIHHVGSTSVPGLGGKGIVDIMIGIKSWKELDDVIKKLKSIGFQHIHPKENGRVFLSNVKSSGLGDIHLHIVKTNGKPYKEILAFRDYLRKNPKTCKKYEKLKEELTVKNKVNRDFYSIKKQNFIKRVLVRTLNHETKRN